MSCVPTSCDQVARQTLVIEPAVAVRCAPGTLQFKALLISDTGEVALSAGVVFASLNPIVLGINPSNGAATLLAPGIATVSVTWQGQMAFAQVTVMGTGDSCCDAVCVQTVVLHDNSKSMGQAWGSGPTMTKATAAHSIIVDFLDALQEKDMAAVVSFNSAPTLRQDWTNSIADLQAGEGATPPSTILPTNLSAAMDSALLRLSGAPECGEPVAGSCAGLHGHGPPTPDIGVPGDTYVDDDSHALYWKTTAGWFP